MVPSSKKRSRPASLSIPGDSQRAAPSEFVWFDRWKQKQKEAISGVTGEMSTITVDLSKATEGKR